MQEEWRDVVGFEDILSVSNTGRVFGKRSGKILKMFTNIGGYKIFTTAIGGKSGSRPTLRLHRLVAEAFLESPSSDLVNECSKTKYGVVLVRHLDNNPSNNVFTNLAWGSNQDNSDDMVKSGRHLQSKPRGVDCLNSKLADFQVSEIRDCYVPKCRSFGARALGRAYGVAHTVISRCVRGITYNAVPQFSIIDS